MSRYLLAVLSITAAAPAALADPSNESTRDYVVRSGDSCLSIAVRELGDRSQLEVLHRMNPDLGKLPHELRPGQVLKLPAGRPISADASLSFQRGDVEVRRAGEQAWFRTETGAELFRAWRVGSRERASAQVTFADTSAISMRENTIVIIYGPTRSAAQLATTRASLETGALRSRLAALDGRERELVVETPASTTTLATGSAVVAVDRAGTTRVSNHQGKPATVTSRTRARKRVQVTPGFGSRVAVGAEPTPPRPLPVAPVWRDAPALALGWAGRGATLAAGWAPVIGAAKYRIELARDRELTEIELRLEAPGTASALEAREVPAGAYWISVVALDDGGFESAPSEPRAVRVVELAWASPGASASASGGAAAAIPLGTELVIPEGLRCTLDGEPAPRLIASAPGTHQIACAGPDGGRAELAMEVAARPTPPAPARTATAPHEVAPEVTPPGVAGSPAPRRGVALDVLGGIGYADRGAGERARLGLALHANATRWLSADLAISRAPASGADTTLRFGGSLRWPGVVEPSLRAGLFVRDDGYLDGDDWGGYGGLGLAIPLAGRIGAIAIVDALRDRRGTFLEAGVGVRIELD